VPRSVSWSRVVHTANLAIKKPKEYISEHNMDKEALGTPGITTSF